eukprot:CAMPEP_0168778532 /NCGR_PEP_ID=MMETSP0725-20121227/7132_1 /TAXON_ID=265536 /ORGANISM="Amphiprora sp., Strain CCMP467" /LENGTH=543 /DNA_ID=CAMNT_0008828307 /DNA_START=167 /DNA_END=1798 /DNA_ORIENTATION=+
MFRKALLLLLQFITLPSAILGRLGDDNSYNIHPRKLQARFLRAHPHAERIDEEFVVKVAHGKQTAGRQIMQDLVRKYDGAILLYEYKFGFAIGGVPESAMWSILQNHPSVILSVEEDVKVHADRSVESWGQDRLDEVNLALDNDYTPPAGLDGSGVDIYIVDTGVKIDHSEFTGRIVPGVDFTGEGAGVDPDGHGTHCAGTAAGGSYGVAKGANIIPVRVLDSNGEGSSADVVKALEWIQEQHEKGGSNKKSVANLSLGGGFNQAENNAVRSAVNAGVVVVAAAGNDDSDACNDSPGAEPTSITVASTDSNDKRAWDSNHGTCVDIFAPGENILSAGIGNAQASDSMSGTSMASPHVAGAAALLLQADPSKAGAAAGSALVSLASSNKVSDAKTGTPNKLLYVGSIGSSSGGSPSPPSPSPPSCATSPPNWKDSYGDSCQWYVDNGCDEADDWADAQGRTASQACCVCGGGTSSGPSPSPPGPTPTPPSPSPPSCSNSPPNWKDSYGDSCQWYVNNGCDEADDWTGTQGKTASQACCVCGGGL